MDDARRAAYTLLGGRKLTTHAATRGIAHVIVTVIVGANHTQSQCLARNQVADGTQVGGDIAADSAHAVADRAAAAISDK